MMLLPVWVQTSFTIQNRGSGISFGNGGHRKMYPAISYQEAERFRNI
jgi:putative ABC transport system permease protein